MQVFGTSPQGTWHFCASEPERLGALDSSGRLDCIDFCGFHVFWMHVLQQWLWLVGHGKCKLVVLRSCYSWQLQVWNLPQGTLHFCFLGFHRYLEDVEGFGLPCFVPAASQIWSGTKKGGQKKCNLQFVAPSLNFSGYNVPGVFLGDTLNILWGRNLHFYRLYSLIFATLQLLSYNYPPMKKQQQM